MVNLHKVFFSIIIPIYNGEKYISECLESVLNQNFNSYEIIIINDGSTDRTSEICESFQNLSPLIKILNKKNSGQVESREIGISRAKGEYILFLDSDDKWEKNAFERLHQVIYDNNPDILMFDYNHFSDSYKCKNIPLSNKFRFWDKSTLCNLLSITVDNQYFNRLWSKAIKRELLTSNILQKAEFKTLRTSEDLLLSIELFTKANTIMYIPDNLYCYRDTPGSITKKYFDSMFDDISIVREQFENYLINCNNKYSDINRLYSRYLTLVAECIIKIQVTEHSLIEKYKKFNHIKNNKFYNKVLLKSKTKSVKFIYRIIIIMFNNNYFKILEIYISYFLNPLKQFKRKLGLSR